MAGNHTVRYAVVLGLAGAFATFAPTPAEAQRWGRPTAPRDGACFYQHADFQGEYFCVRAGDAIQAVPSDMDDQISSIRTFGDAEVTVYQSRGFSGRSARFGDVRNLQEEGWNDRLSSVQVDSSSRSGGFYRRDRDDRDRAGGFGGGGGFRNNNNAERIVRRAYQDVLGRDPDPEGMRTYRSHIIDDNWTEQQVREDLRRSAEFRDRSTMTPQRAAEIVRRAYLSVLNREPDDASQGYVQRVLRENWTEEDVARELRRSPEYRQRRGR
jgi:hypothetical protein